MKYKEKYERLLASEDYLRDLVENQKISMNKLDDNSEEYFGFKVSRAIIKKVLDELGIQTQKPKRKKDLKPYKEEILEYTKKGYKNKEIAKLLTEEYGTYIGERDISAFFKEENELKAIDLQQLILSDNSDVVNDLVTNKGYTIPMIIDYFKNEKDIVVSKSAIFQFLKKNNIEQNKALVEQNRLKRMKQTNQELYGVDNVFAAEEVKEKIKESKLKSKIRDLEDVKLNKELNTLFSNKTNLVNFLTREIFKNNGKLLDRGELAKQLKVKKWYLDFMIYTFQLQDYFKQSKTGVEKELTFFLNDLGIKVINNDREILKPLEIDVYIPEYKIGIEINPSYTHNSTKSSHWGNEIKKTTYHQEKSIKAKRAGIYLIQLYDWDLKDLDKIKIFLNSLFKNVNKEIKVEDCKIVKINEEKAEVFLNRNTLEGYKKAELFLSLKYQDKVVAVLTFNKETDDSYTCVQYIEKEGYSINNGLERLFNAFVRLKRPVKCEVIIDINKYNSTMFTKLGFEEVKLLEPKVYYVNTKTKDIKEVNNSNLLEQGYVEVYDAGRLKMCWKNKFTNS